MKLAIGCRDKLSVWYFSRLLSFLMAVGLASTTARVLAQETGPASDKDRVWFQPPPPSSGQSGLLPLPLEMVSGEILDVDDQRVRVDPGDGDAPTVIATERIVWWEPNWRDPKAQEGMSLFSEGKYVEALSPLLAAAQQPRAVWQQQWLLGHLALAATEAERYPAALEIVKQLAASDPPAPMWALLPIRWNSRQTPPVAVAAARAVIDSEHAAVRLVAGSWMLSSPEDRLVAERMLDAVEGDRRQPWLSRLAGAVKWRRTPIPQIANLSKQWSEEVDRFPVLLQGGPLIVIGDRLASAGDKERASEYLLSVNLLHRLPKPIAAQAE